jgi:hypothetical protein
MPADSTEEDVDRLVLAFKLAMQSDPTPRPIMIVPDPLKARNVADNREPDA